MLENGLTLEGVADDLDNVKSVMFTLAAQYGRIDATLDRTTIKQEANTVAIANLTANTEAMRADITQLGLQVGEMRSQMSQLALFMINHANDMRSMQADIKVMQADIKEMQAEVRGLQIENRRILQHVFGDEF